MSNLTPAGRLQRHGRRATFREVKQGERFALNGNVWIKRSSRTAAGVWPAVLPEWAYVSGHEVVHIEDLDQ